MNLADLAKGLSGLASLPGFEEYAAQQRALDERATFLRQARPISRGDAVAVALFSRGTWAAPFPTRGYDLGKDAGLFIVDWLTAHHVGPTEEYMQTALQEWQGGAFVARIGAAIAGC